MARVYRAPGRVNLIGEHTDYNLGLVLPMAIDLACHVSREPASDAMLRVWSEQLRQERAWPAASIPASQPAGDWGDHVLGVAWELMRRGYRIEPASLRIDSQVPMGGGLSSSAALGVATALALAGRPIPPLELATLCRAAETDFVGIPCGIMDQFVSAYGGALMLDCRSLEWQRVNLPAGVAVLAVNSMVKHELGESAYRTRVEECRAAAQALGKSSLREVPESDLARLTGVMQKRARHVVTENRRVMEFVRTNDPLEMGKLLVASHRSLRDDYEVSCGELDFLVERALEIRGVFGARMTGGGFGGCTVNLVAGGAAERFEAEIRESYRRRFGLEPKMYRCAPAEAAGEAKA